jgi:ABC-type lipoprotein release transport system permease subunit
MALLNWNKRISRRYWPVKKRSFSLSGHGLGVGITVIFILIIIAMVYNLQEGCLSE